MMRKTLLSCIVLSLLCLISHTSAVCIFGKTAVQDGETFPQNQCTFCTCTNGNLDCSEQTCPELHCYAHEYPEKLQEGDCCPVCIPKLIVEPAPYLHPSCNFEGEFTDPANPCLTCTCHNGRKACLDVAGACEPLECERTLVVEGQCCPQCAQPQEQSLPTNDCSEQTCPELHCYAHEYPEKLQEGDCCPVCIPKLIVEPAQYLHPSCNFEGEFTDPANPCLTCTCHNGRKACLDVAGACEPLECERTLVVEGQCCPQCAQPQEQSLPTSDCSEQTCPELHCYAHEYPEKLQEGDCCPVCVPKLQIEPLYPQSCRVNDNTVIQHGSSYPKDACTTCTCSNGILGCAREICPAPSCPRGQVPVRSRGECCERCSLPPTPKPTRCVQGSRRHNLDCSTCVCVDGGFVCHHDRVRCPYNLEPRKNNKQAIVGGSSQETGKDQILEMPRLRKARN